jgi:hypothetical protein
MDIEVDSGFFALPARRGGKRFGVRRCCAAFNAPDAKQTINSQLQAAHWLAASTVAAWIAVVESQIAF